MAGPRTHGWQHGEPRGAGLEVRLAFCQVGSGVQGQLLGAAGGGYICSDFGPWLGTASGWAPGRGGTVAPVQARDAKVCGGQQSEDPEGKWGPGIRATGFADGIQGDVRGTGGSHASGLGPEWIKTTFRRRQTWHSCQEPPFGALSATCRGHVAEQGGPDVVLGSQGSVLLRFQSWGVLGSALVGLKPGIYLLPTSGDTC